MIFLIVCSSWLCGDIISLRVGSAMPTPNEIAALSKDVDRLNKVAVEFLNELSDFLPPRFTDPFKLPLLEASKDLLQASYVYEIKEPSRRVAYQSAFEKVREVKNRITELTIKILHEKYKKLENAYAGDDWVLAKASEHRNFSITLIEEHLHGYQDQLKIINLHPFQRDRILESLFEDMFPKGQPNILQYSAELSYIGSRAQTLKANSDQTNRNIDEVKSVNKKLVKVNTELRDIIRGNELKQVEFQAEAVKNQKKIMRLQEITDKVASNGLKVSVISLIFSAISFFAGVFASDTPIFKGLKAIAYKFFGNGQ